MRKRPNINSSIKEIEDYEPKNWGDVVSWFKTKQELVREKNSFWHRFKQKAKGFL